MNRWKSDNQVKRRSVLGVIGAAAGLSAMTGPVLAHDHEVEDQIVTRPCDDSEFRSGEDWDCALTTHVCDGSDGIRFYVRSDGSITDNRSALPENESGSKYYEVDAGDRFTIWFTGRLTRLDVRGNGEYNMAIAGRTPLETTGTVGGISPWGDSITGLVTSTTTVTTPEHETEDQIVTRPCDDSEFREGEDWDSALTTHVCGDSDEIDIRIQVGEAVTNDRNALPENLSQSDSFTVNPGDRLTIWFNGRIEMFDASEGDYNMAIAGRYPTDN